MSPIKPNEEVEIETEITKMGRTIVFSDCRIFTNIQQGRKLACKGSHIKAVANESWDFMKDLKDLY